MRVAQFIQTVDMTAGGTSTAFLNTLAALQGLKAVSVHAYAQRPVSGDLAQQTIEADPSKWTLGDYSRSPLWPGPLGHNLADAVRRGLHDVVHLHGLWSPDLLHAARACINAGVPYFIEPHGMLIREAIAQKAFRKKLFMAIGMRRALERSAGLIFVTSEEREHSVIPASIGPERRHVVALPVDMPQAQMSLADRAAARTRFDLPAPADAPVVVFMGRFHLVKRVELCIKALVHAKESHLLLIGGGDDPYVATLKALADQLGVSKRVKFGGWVRGDDKWLALAAGEVLTLNSVHENFGYVAVEALCVGTIPVLTRNLSIAPELQAAGVGLECDPAPEALARAWQAAIALARGPGGAERRAQGREWVRRELSGPSVAAKLLAIYQSVLARTA